MAARTWLRSAQHTEQRAGAALILSTSPMLRTTAAAHQVTHVEDDLRLVGGQVLQRGAGVTGVALRQVGTGGPSARHAVHIDSVCAPSERE